MSEVPAKISQENVDRYLILRGTDLTSQLKRQEQQLKDVQRQLERKIISPLTLQRMQERVKEIVEPYADAILMSSVAMERQAVEVHFPILGRPGRKHYRVGWSDADDEGESTHYSLYYKDHKDRGRDYLRFRRLITKSYGKSKSSSDFEVVSSLDGIGRVSEIKYKHPWGGPRFTTVPSSSWGTMARIEIGIRLNQNIPPCFYEQYFSDNWSYFPAEKYTHRFNPELDLFTYFDSEENRICTSSNQKFEELLVQMLGLIPVTEVVSEKPQIQLSSQAIVREIN